MAITAQTGGHSAAGKVEQGASFPTSPDNGDKFWRTDLREEFHFDEPLGRWLGEARQDGYGDGGSHNNNQYFRRYNGMGTGPDRGIYFPYDIIITEHGANWESGGTTGGIEIQTGGSTVIHYLPTNVTPDQNAEEGLSIIVAGGTPIAFRRDGNSISNTQGWFVYRKLI